jgi:hypothetical protein
MPDKGSLLRLNSNVQDPFLIGGESKFEYRHWATKRNFIKYREVLPPKEADGWTWSGVSVTRQFDLEKLDEKLMRVKLEMDVAAPSGGTPGTYLRFCDYLVCLFY